MQFPTRIVVLIITFSAIFLFQGFIWSKSNDVDNETRILELLAVLETHVTEYESVIRSFRSELLFMRDETNRGCGHIGPNEDKQNKDSSRAISSSSISQTRLRTMNIYNALPHLLDYEDALVPALTIGRERVGVSLVIGIPTVKRPGQSYLLSTLQNLLNSMLPAEKNDTLIIVFIAEPDVSFVQQTVSTISKSFKREVDSGLIEIVSPSGNFYPDLKSLKGTLGDSDDRTRWRTKQNLDYAYLMLYAQNRGTYYIQLEDDVLSKKGFVSNIKSFALQKTVEKEEWFMLDFCQLGFIGKLFRSSDLWRLVEFFLIFYKDKPGDWLLSHFFSVKYCKLDQSHKKCLKELGKHWIHYKPSLFQHIGMVSSLSGKVQKLKDRQFGKLELFMKHDNPDSKIETSLKHYGKYSLVKAYQGKDFFWGLAPAKGDVIKFSYDPPLYIKSYRIVTGNIEHPSDKLRNATLEIRPLNKPGSEFSFHETGDGFYQLDEFDELGLLEGTVPESLNPASVLRITFNGASENWVIISEISIDKDRDKN